MLDLSNTNQDTSRDVETTREILADVTPRQSRRKQILPTRRVAMLNREIRRLQRTTSFMIPRMCFARLVRQILFEETNPGWRMSTAALEALQTATEMYITQRMEDAFLLTLHRGRVTLDLRDLRLVSFMMNRRGEL
ncbi:hypothetical protein KR215_000883 [Drosophila sulfurigaster]|nr:hypothetical protein KR215_000883 [Drosophila sulfurigaster]